MEKLPSNGELPIINTLDYILTKHKGIKDPRVHFSRLIDALMFDYERTRNRRVLTKEELDQHYRNTFFPLIDFMFESLDSELTAEDVPTLTYGQANWQSYKDINEDWSEGRINIPSEILKQANLNHNDPLEKVLKNYIIHDWFAETLKKTREDFKQLGVDYNNHPEPLPKLILMIASRYFTTIIPKL